MRELTSVTTKMPHTSSAALAEFVKINPQQNGIHWDDALALLLDADAHLDITEPMWETLQRELRPDQCPYILPVTFTLYYANKGAPPPASVVKDFIEDICP